MFTVFGIALAVAVLGGIIFAALESARASKLKEFIAAVPGFRATHMHVGTDGRTGIAVDEQAELFCLASSTPSGLTYRLVPYASILATELSEDDAVISQVSRSSQVMGAAAGGLLFGGLGAAVGAMTGKRTERRKVRRVEVRLIVENISNPTHSVVFQNVEAARNGLVHKLASTQAREWQARAEVAIHQGKRAALIASVPAQSDM